MLARSVERIDPLAELVGLAYAAAIDAGRWGVFLERYRQALDSACTTFMVWDPGARATSISVAAGPAADEAVRAYHTYYGTLNPHLHAVALPRLGEITLSHVRYPVGRLLKTEYFNDYLRPFDMDGVIGAWLDEREGAHAHLCCLRPFRRGFFGVPEIAKVRVLFPHLQRAVRIHAVLDGLRLDHRSDVEGLERLTTGVLVVTRDGAVRWANAKARRLLASRDGLIDDGERLRAETAAGTRDLRTLIGQASRCASGEDLDGGGVLRLSRSSFAPPLSVLVAPMYPPIPHVVWAEGCVTLLVRDPVDVTDNQALLRGLYGLTAAQARLAEHLLTGTSVSESAEALGIAAETARSHLKSILRKSGIHRQSDFVRAAAGGLASYVQAYPRA